MANFNIQDYKEQGVSQVRNMFPGIATNILPEYVTFTDETSFDYEVRSVHTYVALVVWSGSIGLGTTDGAIKKAMLAWNEAHTPLVMRYQVVAEADVTNLGEADYKLTVSNLGLTISGDGVTAEDSSDSADWSNHPYMMDINKAAPELMVGEQLTRRIIYHQEHTKISSNSSERVSGHIGIAEPGHGAVVLLQFGAAVDEAEFQTFMTNRSVRLSEEGASPEVSFTVGSIGAFDSSENPRVFVGSLKDDTEEEFAEMKTAKYEVHIDGYCALRT